MFQSPGRRWRSAPRDCAEWKGAVESAWSDDSTGGKLPRGHDGHSRWPVVELLGDRTTQENELSDAACSDTGGVRRDRQRVERTGTPTWAVVEVVAGEGVWQSESRVRRRRRLGEVEV